jgi:plastocyanin
MAPLLYSLLFLAPYLTSAQVVKAPNPQVHTIQVGADGFTFSPQQISVPPGDIVTFEFYPVDHSVAQAEYGIACSPYDCTGRDKHGFWSDVQNVATLNDVG